MPHKDPYLNIESTFIKRVGDSEKTRFWLPEVKVLPEIMQKHLHQEMTYFILIQMRVKVLKHLISSDFAKELQANYNNGYNTIWNTYKNLRDSLGSLKASIRRYCKENETTEIQILASLLGSSEALNLLSKGQLTLGKLLIYQPEIFFAVDFNASKK